jgi:hypothetical protein
MPSFELGTTLLAGNIILHYHLLISRNSDDGYDDDDCDYDGGEGDYSVVICLHGNLIA